MTRIAVMAAGGVGGYLATKLIEAGHEVGLIARGDHLTAVNGGAKVSQRTAEKSATFRAERRLGNGMSASVSLLMPCLK